jgi:hypothetical protein
MIVENKIEKNKSRRDDITMSNGSDIYGRRTR